jgi:hypothetical protein
VLVVWPAPASASIAGQGGRFNLERLLTATTALHTDDTEHDAHPPPHLAPTPHHRQLSPPPIPPPPPTAATPNADVMSAGFELPVFQHGQSDDEIRREEQPDQYLYPPHTTHHTYHPSNPPSAPTQPTTQFRCHYFPPSPPTSTPTPLPLDHQQRHQVGTPVEKEKTPLRSAAAPWAPVPGVAPSLYLGPRGPVTAVSTHLAARLQHLHELGTWHSHACGCSMTPRKLKVDPAHATPPSWVP